MTLFFILKTFLLGVLGFVLLSYTIYLYEKANRDGVRIRQMINPANLLLCVRVILFEYLCCLVSILFWPFGFINSPERTTEASQPPILLLHGVFQNRACWTVMKWRLRLQGITNLHTINLPGTRDVETLTEKVGLKVDSLRLACKCDKVLLFGHSMGGVIARNFIQIRGGADKVDLCIALGSPHAGSKLAPFAVMKLSEALMPASEFLANLNRQAIPDTVAIINIYSRHDNLVIPYDYAKLNQVNNIELSGIGHNSLLYSNRAFNQVLAAIRSVNHADNTDQKPQPG